MIANMIRNTLEKLNVQLELESDSITFDHPACPDAIRCIVSWEPKENLVMFAANHDITLPKNISAESFAQMLNDSNYKSYRGSLEYDGEDTLIYRSATFLPPEEAAEKYVFNQALKDFLKLAKIRIEKICIRLTTCKQKKKTLFSVEETDRFFSEQIFLMEKELDVLYSPSCTIPGKERSEQILNTEHLIQLFKANLSGNDHPGHPGQQFNRSKLQ